MKKWLVVSSLSLVMTYSVQAKDLMDVYHLASKNDGILKVAMANLKTIEQGKVIAETAYGTHVTVTGDIDGNRQDVQSTGANTYHTQLLSLSLSKLLYSKTSALKIEKTDAIIAQNVASFKATEQALMFRVAQTYFNVLSAKDSLTFSQSENAAIARQLDQATQRFDVGLTAITAVHEAQAVYDQSNADLISAETALDDAKEALSEITHQYIDDFASLSANLVLNPPTPANIDTWSDTAQQENLAIKVAISGVDAAKKEIAVQDAGDSATVNFTASHALFKSSLTSASDTNTTNIGLGFTLPLYQGGSVRENVKLATFSLEVAHQTLDKERRLIKRQVRDAYRGVVASISQVKALKASAVSSKSALEATKAGFEVGTRTIVDVLNSERDLYRSMSSLSKLRYTYILNGLSLKQATGTLSVDDLKQVNSWLKH